jgi:hypothetical protein
MRTALHKQEMELQEASRLDAERGGPPPNSTALLPVPILPKLARAYISSKQSTTFRAPPMPAPTAHWLVHKRPHPDPQVGRLLLVNVAQGMEKVNLTRRGTLTDVAEERRPSREGVNRLASSWDDSCLAGTGNYSCSGTFCFGSKHCVI